MSTPDVNEIQQRAQRLNQASFNDLWSLVAESASILRETSPNQRRMWLTSVVEDMRQEQGGDCALCLAPLRHNEGHVDHIIPFCYGGGNERTNIQLAHASCNRSKGAEVSPKDLLRYLESRYKNR